MPNGRAKFNLRGLGRALRGYTGIGIAKPSKKAFRVLYKAGYTTRTTSRGATTITGRTVSQTKRFMGIRYKSTKTVPLKSRSRSR